MYNGCYPGFCPGLSVVEMYKLFRVLALKEIACYHQAWILRRHCRLRRRDKQKVDTRGYAVDAKKSDTASIIAGLGVVGDWQQLKMVSQLQTQRSSSSAYSANFPLQTEPCRN